MDAGSILLGDDAFDPGIPTPAAAAAATDEDEDDEADDVLVGVRGARGEEGAPVVDAVGEGKGPLGGGLGDPYTLSGFFLGLITGPNLGTACPPVVVGVVAAAADAVVVGLLPGPLTFAKTDCK